MRAFVDSRVHICVQVTGVIAYLYH